MSETESLATLALMKLLPRRRQLLQGVCQDRDAQSQTAIVSRDYTGAHNEEQRLKRSAAMNGTCAKHLRVVVLPTFANGHYQ